MTTPAVLLGESHTPQEKARVQGFNDLAVFATMGVSSLASGALVSHAGWERMNVAALPFLVAVLAALLWFRRVRARPAFA